MKVIPAELTQLYEAESRTRTNSFLGVVASLTTFEGLAVAAAATEHPIATLALAGSGIIAARYVGEPGLDAHENLRHIRHMINALPEQHLPASGQ